MYLPKSTQCGSMIHKYDPINKILFISWKDSKVVQLVSTLSISGITSAKRRCGSQLISVPYDENAKEYVAKMGAVDRINQRNKAAGGFAMRIHYHKWYKRCNFEIKDLMLNQGEVAWNVSLLINNLKYND